MRSDVLLAMLIILGDPTGVLLHQGDGRQPRRPLGHNNPTLQQEAAKLVDNRRALANKPAPNAMERLKIQLFGALDWYEPHGRPLHGFGDCFGIAIVVLVPFAERPNVLCRDQTDIMPQGEKSSTKVMRAGASLKANETRRQVSHASFQSSPRLSLAHSDLAASVHPDEVEDVFPQVDAHGYDLISVHCDVSHGAFPLNVDCLLQPRHPLCRSAAGPYHYVGFRDRFPLRRVQLAQFASVPVGRGFEEGQLSDALSAENIDALLRK